MKSISDVRLYVLLTGAVARRPALDVARMLIEGGVDAIQLREKDMPDDEYLRLAEKMAGLCRGAGVLFIVNDRVAISRLAGADGVHVGQDDLPAVEARKIIGRGRILGVSTHDIRQAEKAQADGADYIGVGPVYPTSTKGYENGVGLEFIREAASQISIPFFAIGGITLDRLDEVLSAGAARVAVSSAIIAAAEPLATTKKFRKQLTNVSP